MSINNATPAEWDAAADAAGLTLHRTILSELSDEILTSTFAPLETLQAVNPNWRHSTLAGRMKSCQQ